MVQIQRKKLYFFLTIIQNGLKQDLVIPLRVWNKAKKQGLNSKIIMVRKTQSRHLKKKLRVLNMFRQVIQ